MKSLRNPCVSGANGQLAVGLLLCGLAFGQVVNTGVTLNPTREQLEEAQQRKALLRRTGQLKTTLRLDRPTYLLGESIQIDISVANTTALPLEVLAPFTCDAGGGINVWALRNKEWQGLLPEEYEFGTRSERPPTIVLGGWQEITRSLRSSDELGCNVALNEPPQPGLYRINYSYGGPAVEFRVVQAQFKGLYHVPLAKSEQAIDFTTGKPLVDSQTGKNIEYPRELKLAVLCAEEAYYLVVTRFGRVLNGSFHPQEDTEFDYSAGRYMYPFIRIAESSEPIVSVTASADREENLTVHWATADGQSRSVSLNADRETVGIGTR
jgi:hypothetical protein